MMPGVKLRRVEAARVFLSVVMATSIVSLSRTFALSVAGLILMLALAATVGIGVCVDGLVVDHESVGRLVAEGVLVGVGVSVGVPVLVGVGMGVQVAVRVGVGVDVAALGGPTCTEPLVLRDGR